MRLRNLFLAMAVLTGCDPLEKMAYLKEVQPGVTVNADDCVVIAARTIRNGKFDRYDNYDFANGYFSKDTDEHGGIMHKSVSIPMSSLYGENRQRAVDMFNHLAQQPGGEKCDAPRFVQTLSAEELHYLETPQYNQNH